MGKLRIGCKTWFELEWRRTAGSGSWSYFTHVPETGAPWWPDGWELERRAMRETHGLVQLFQQRLEAVS